MKILITLLKPLSFLPALLMMYLIFSFSAQTGEVSGELSYKISYKIVEVKSEVLHQEKSYDELTVMKLTQIHLLCTKSSSYDRIFPSGRCRFFPALRLPRREVSGCFFSPGSSVWDLQDWMNTTSLLSAGRTPAVRDVCI